MKTRKRTHCTTLLGGVLLVHYLVILVVYSKISARNKENSTTSSSSNTGAVSIFHQLFLHPASSSAAAASSSSSSLEIEVVVDHGNGQACRYDGHCTIGMTCGVAPLFPKQQQHQPQDMDNNHPPGECLYVPIVVANTNPSYNNHNNHNRNHKQSNQDYLEHCQAACQAELELDEHFFHEAWPDIVSGSARATTATTRPKGCVLDYVRQDDQVDHWNALHAPDTNNNGIIPRDEPLPSILTWEKTRFRHLIRVDPVLVSHPRATTTPGTMNSSSSSTQPTEYDSKTQVWRAYCTAPCQSHRDCQTAVTTSLIGAVRPSPWLCVEGACQRNPQFWEPRRHISHYSPPPPNHWQSNATTTTTMMTTTTRPPQLRQEKGKLVFVTGATKNFYRALRNLVASIRYWTPNHGVVIYNLGGLGMYRQQIQTWDNCHCHGMV
ncbi:hypothetical protein ACA910_018694 [Epithemia clementina (nom. ined.)]